METGALLFKTTYALVMEVTKCMEKYPKSHRYTLGDNIMKVAIDLLTYLGVLNSEKGWTSDIAVKTLNNFKYKFETLVLLLRLSYDLELYSTQQQSKFVELIEKVKEALSLLVV